MTADDDRPKDGELTSAPEPAPATPAADAGLPASDTASESAPDTAPAIASEPAPAPAPAPAPDTAPPPAPLFRSRKPAVLAIEAALFLIPVVVLSAGVITKIRALPSGLSAAASDVRSKLQKGDVVLVNRATPPTAADAFHGMPFVALPPQIPDLSGFTRVFLVETEEIQGPVFGADGFPGLGPVTHNTRFGKTSVALQANVRASLLKLSGGVSASFGQPGAQSPCARQQPNGPLVCPNAPGWVVVGPRLLPVQGRNFPCVHAHPDPSGELRVEYPNFPFARELSLWTALADSAGAVAPIRVSVFRGPQPLGSYDHTRSPGWQRMSLSTAQPSAESTLAITFTVSTPGRYHLCFTGGTL
ncbi:MAG: hypothetical protein HYY84_10510 [Deltaproteobacteria bacterium]|nr:hypothetical protein [Deltaproteobacteria bacterium]